jgi:uncharacterized phage protein (TIGR02220 family)
VSFAYLALFTGDYLRDTRHLTPEEHGCYLLLLMHCWDQKGPAPLDERKQCGIVNARSGGEIESLRRIREEFFVRMDDGWYNKRMTEEVAKSEALSKAFRKAGLKSAAVRREKVREVVSERRLKVGSAEVKPWSVSPSPSPSPSLTPSLPKTLGEVSPKTPLLAQARDLLQFTNEKTGRNFRPTEVNLKFIEGRLREGYSVQECRAVVARKCREWGADDKMRQYLRPATLFNREKFSQYVGDVDVKVS